MRMKHHPDYEHIAQMERELGIAQPSWDELGDVLYDDRLPDSIKQGLARGRQLSRRGINLKAANGPFRQMVDGSVMLNDQTAITDTTEATLFPTAQYAGFAANQLRAGQKWLLTCMGKMTTASSSQGNITITPRFGTSSSGTSMGASSATALVASATNKLWQLDLTMTVRAVGNAGANSTIIGFGVFMCDVAIIAASTGNAVMFGGTAASVDLSVPQGLYIGITLGNVSDTMTCQDLTLESLN